MDRWQNVQISMVTLYGFDENIGNNPDKVLRLAASSPSLNRPWTAYFGRDMRKPDFIACKQQMRRQACVVGPAPWYLL